jgi:hypothetical protein
LRAITDKEGLTLKACFRRSLDQAGGGDAFQHTTRMKAANLSKCGSANEDNMDKFVGIDVAVECDREAGAPIIVAAMAELLGYKLVPIGQGEGGDTEAVTLRDALTISKKAGNMVREIDDALEDGKVDAFERDEIVSRADELMKALHGIVKRIGGAR